jgi:hypothetical protein
MLMFAFPYFLSAFPLSFSSLNLLRLLKCLSSEIEKEFVETYKFPNGLITEMNIK